MRDDLDEPIRRALHDARLDLSLEFNHAADGTKSGTVVLRNADGKAVAEVPLDSPEAMNVALARLVQLGFRNSVPAPRLDPATPQAPSRQPAGRGERARGRCRRLPQGLGGGLARPQRRRRGLDARHVRRGAVAAGAGDRGRHSDRPARARRTRRPMQLREPSSAAAARAASFRPRRARPSRHARSRRRTRSRGRSPARGSPSRRSRSARRSSRCTRWRRSTSG